MQAAKKIFKLNSKNNLCKFIGKCNYDGAANTQKGIAYPAIHSKTKWVTKNTIKSFKQLSKAKD